MIPLRGVDRKNEQDAQKLIRDTRTMGQRSADFFSNPGYSAIVLMTFGVAAYTLPAMADVIFVIGTIIFWYTNSRRLSLPYRMPLYSGEMDYNDPLPGSRKPRKARGIYFFGNDKQTNEELWFNNDDMRTHVLIFGSTGSGKTEALVSLAYNALLQASGFIYVDGKGDNSLFTKLFSMARYMGREDDLLLINFMTGAKDIIGPQEKRLSNTMNPFANGSSSMISQLVVSLMDASSASPDGDMWKGRAIVFVEALMRTLVYARDKGHLLLDAHTVRNYFKLPRIESLVWQKKLERDDGLEAVSLADAPDVVLQPLESYLDTLPGYDKGRIHKQGSQTLEQHGYITMQLTRVFSSLADTYGHILRTNLAEVDLRDVVLNRRILVVLLPALEKSPDELSNLGKVIIASLKAMMAAGLGDEVEGAYADIVERKPTNASTPFLCILDEYGYYAVKGFAVVPAQARSLGFSTVFAGQDLPAFQKASKEEAASIGANTNIKICMKLEDPMETWEFFQKTAGEAYVTKVDAFQTNSSSVTNNYLDTRSASTDRRSRIDLLDLKDQSEGEAHIFFKSRIVRARLFYADPKPVSYLRVNHFLRVEPPEKDDLIHFEVCQRRFWEAMQKPGIMDELYDQNEDIDFVAKQLRKEEGSSLIEKGVATLIAYDKGAEESEVEVQDEEELLTDQELNVFVGLRLTQIDKEDVKIDDFEAFSKALLDKQFTHKQSEFIERLSGVPASRATGVAEEVVRDMQLATYYPPEIEEFPSNEQLIEVIDEIIDHIDVKLKEKDDD